MQVHPPEEILHYWFGDLAGPGSPPGDREALWWGEDRSTDYFIRQTFEPSLTAARTGQLESWREQARPSLALLILMDRMSRSMYRGLDCAFENDLTCQILCLEGVEDGRDQELWPLERVFFYLPLVHAEDLEVQERGVELLEALHRGAPDTLARALDQALGTARRHRDLIARFGRFPQRNQLLGRRSTSEEAAYLLRPGGFAIRT